MKREDLGFHLSRFGGISDDVIKDFLLHRDVSNKFIGVFCCHQLSRISRLAGMPEYILILNVQGHWVTIYKRPAYILYLDSYGDAPVNDKVKTFLSTLKLPVFYNDKIIQHPNSNFCGLYACLWTLIFDNKIKEKPVFTSNLFANDDICINALKRMKT